MKVLLTYKRLVNKFTALLDGLFELRRPFFGEHTIIIALAFVVGLLAGAANVLFRSTLDLANNILFVGGSRVLGIEKGGMYRVLLPLVPMAGALLLIPFSLYFPGEINGYGLPKFIEKVNVKGGFIRFRNFFLKIIGPALTIGSGASAGIEGPVAIVGGTVGSGVAHLFRSSAPRTKLLIAAGSAGAIAAIFNAPIAGVMFSTEIILLGDYELASFAAVIISAGIATVVSRGVYGANPAFAVPQYDLKSPLEIPLYMVLGLIVGVIAVIYIRTYYRIKDAFESYRLNSQLKPVLGAFMVGVIGIFLPQVLGNGYGFIQDVLAGKILFPLVILVIFFKILATAITLGSGGSGGVFAPALLIGATAGGSFGYAVHSLMPSVSASPGAYATVGIGSFLSATLNAPLTGIFLLFEMTGNYKIIVPLMLTSIIGTLIARKIDPESIDSVELSRRGINLHSGKDLSLMNRLRVADFMTRDFTTVREHTLLKGLIDLMIKEEQFYLPVVDSQREMIGIVSFQDVREVIFEEKVKRVVTAAEIATEKVSTVRPSDNLNTAMQKLVRKDIEEIPVVDENNQRRVIAMLRHTDIISAYNREILKSP